MSTRDALRADLRLAQVGQQRRAEDYSRGGREETAGFYGSDKVAPADTTERRLTLADADREARALAQHNREHARRYRESRAAYLTGVPLEEVFDRVLEHTGDEWKAAALHAVAQLAATGRRFQAHDIVRRYAVPEPHHPNAWGAVFNIARRSGLIEHAGYAQSARPTSQRSVLRVWKGTRR